MKSKLLWTALLSSLAANLAGAGFLAYKWAARQAPRPRVQALERRTLFDALAIPPRALVMLGASHIERGEWAELLGPAAGQVINRGIAGDTTLDVLARLDAIVASQPAVVMLDISGNDLAEGRSVAEILVTYRAILDRFGEATPDTRLIMVSVLPVHRALFDGSPARVHGVAELDRALEALARERNATYLDLAALLVDESTGQLARQYTLDGIHLTGPAYRIWGDALRPLVAPGPP